MKYKSLGKTGIDVSMISMGGDMNIFQTINPEGSMKILKKQLHLDISFQDLEAKIARKSLHLLLI